MSAIISTGVSRSILFESFSQQIRKSTFFRRYKALDLLHSDRQQIKGETTNCFKEESDGTKSVRDYTEDEITDWILNNDSRRNFFISKLFDDPSRVTNLRRLERPFTPDRGKPGDIDILLFDPIKLNKSIAIECKRVKVEAINEDESKINGAQNISEGVIQANKYLDLGFSKVFLTILHASRRKKVKNSKYPSQIWKRGVR